MVGYCYLAKRLLFILKTLNTTKMCDFALKHAVLLRMIISNLSNLSVFASLRKNKYVLIKGDASHRDGKCGYFKIRGFAVFVPTITQ